MATKTEDYLGITDYKVIGTRPIRHDGVDKVTGRAVYGADVQMAGLLHGRILRSPHAHARIKSIDTSFGSILGSRHLYGHYRRNRHSLLNM
jgi:xanthine dehydrogenase molybdopterin-binding subunit B